MAVAAQPIPSPEVDFVYRDGRLPVGGAEYADGTGSAQLGEGGCRRTGSAMPSVGAVNRLEETTQYHLYIEFFALYDQDRGAAVVRSSIISRGICH